MPIGTIISAKDTAQGYASLLLFTVTFGDGTFLRLCSQALNTGEGGFQYAGNDYYARVISQDLGPIQALSSLGFDVVPNISLKLADADAFLQKNYEAIKGFGGARIDVDLVLQDVTQTDYSYSSDTQRRFSGIVDPPNINEADASFSLTAISRFNMARRHVPSVPIQPRCPWIFPPAPSFHQQAADDRTSPFYQCGYSPTATGGNARGNGSFTTCGYTKGDCTARGMYTKDSINRQTGRFGGSQWTRDSSYFKGKQYTTGTTVDGYDVNTTARYGDLYPLIYGTQNITDCPVMNVFGDPNSTRFEVVVGFGQMDVQRVVVNGVVVSQGGRDVLFTWRYTNTGTRNGLPQNDKGYYNGQGDPYGSLCCIEIVVPISLQQSSGTPKVAILAKRVDVPLPATNNASDALGWPIGYTTNPAYILLDLLINSGNFTYADIDIASFRAAAANVCDHVIPYMDLRGSSTFHERYRACVYYRQPKPLSQVITNLRQSFLGILAPNSFNGGLLQLFVEQTLADQQGAAISGSNYNTAIASKQASGTVANGFVAYSFDESNIFPGSFQSKHNTLQQNGNRITFQFQDSENQYAQDSISQVNAPAVAAAGNQEIDSQFQVEGIENFDQAGRIANIQLFKSLLGNPRGDAKGSVYVEFTTTVRATHLKASDIVQLTWQRLGLAAQQFRIRSIQPTANSEQIKIIASWHSDDWYVDATAQIPAQLFSSTGLKVPNRDPYPWKPAGEQGFTGDVLYGTAPSFRMALDYAPDAAGNPVPVIDIKGYPPANALSSIAFPPLMPLQGTTANIGGNIAPGNYVFAISAIDDSSPAQRSALSNLTLVSIPAGTNTNTASIPSLYFQPGTASYAVYFGFDESTLEFVGTGAASDSSYTLTNFGGLPRLAYSPPDVKFSLLIAQATRARHVGRWALGINLVAGNVLTFTGQNFDTDDCIGCVLSLIGQAAPVVTVPQLIVNVTVTAKSGATLTVSADVSSVLAVGDLVTLRMKLNTLGTTTIGDSGLLSSVFPGGLAVNQESGAQLVVIAGTGAGQSRSIASNTTSAVTLAQPFDRALDATSIVVILEASALPEVASDSITFDGRVNAFGPPLVIAFPVQNYAKQVLFIRVLTADTNGNHGPTYLAPFREIYISGKINTATSTGSGTPPASNVAIVSVTPSKNFSTGNIDLTAVYTPPVDNSAKGIQGFLELPDFSYGTLLSSTTTNADAAIVPGVRIDLGVKTDMALDGAGNVTVVFETDKLFTVFAQRGRLYLDSVNAAGTANILVSADQSGPTPSLVFTVGSAENGGIGQEYAPLVTGISVDQRGFPLLRCYTETQKTASGWEYRPVVQWDDPTAAANPDRIQQFQGVDVDLLQVLDTTILYSIFHATDPMGFGRLEAPMAPAGRSTIKPGIGQYTGEYKAVPDPPYLFVVDALSVGPGGVNNFSPLMTPQGYFYTPLLSDLIKRGGTGTGQQAAPLADVTNFSVTAGYAYDLSGAFDYLARPYFTQPKDLTAWNDIALVLNIPAGSAYYYNLGYPSMGNGDSNDLINIDKSAWPTVPATWRFIAVSTDSNGTSKYKDLDNLTAIRTAGGTPDFGTSPTFDVAVDGPYQPDGSGIEVAPLVGSVYAQINFGQSVDGTEFYFLSGGVSGEPITDDRYWGYVIKSSVNGSIPKPVVYLAPDTPTWEGPHQPIPSGGPFPVVVVAISKNAAGDENNYVPGKTPGVLCRDLLQALTTGMLDASRSNPAKLGGGVQVSGGKLKLKTDGTTLVIDATDTAKVNLDGTSLDIVLGKVGVKALDLGLALGSSFNSSEFRLTGGKLTVQGVDLGKAIASTLSSELAVTGGTFGVASVSAAKITAGTLAAGVIYTGSLTAGQIVSGTIGAGVIYAGTVNASQVNAGTLGAGVIYAGTIDATQITTGSLSASRIGAGTIAASISLTSPSIQITSGSTVINLDSTNFIKLSSSGFTVALNPSVGIKVSTTAGGYSQLLSNGTLQVSGPSTGTTTISGNNLTMVNSTFNAQVSLFVPASGSGGGLQVGAQQVVGPRQADPGSGITLAQIRAILLAHGLIG